MVGTWLQMTAMGWLIWRLTNSYFMVGIFQFIGLSPNLFFSPFGGVLADRHSRYKILIRTQTLLMVQALVLAAVTLFGIMHLPLLAVLAFSLGTVMAFDVPSRQALVIEMVGQEDLPGAIALNSFLFNGARMIGPAIAGILTRLTSEGVCFLLNGLSYIAVVAMLFKMKLRPREIAPHKGTALKNFVEALQYVRSHPAYLNILLFMAFMSMIAFPAQALMAGLANEVLGREAGGYGLLLSAQGVGAMFGAVLLSRGVEGLGFGRYIAAAGLVIGCALICLSFSHLFWLSCLLLMPFGAAMMFQIAGTNTFIQLLVPDRFRGRMMSLFTMVFLGLFPLGSLLLGSLAQVFGSPLPVLRMSGLACMVASVVLMTRLDAIRSSVLLLREA